MRTIAFVLQKGGTAKTTTALNLGTELARRGFRVLLLDLDAQGSLTAKLRCPVEHDVFHAGLRVFDTAVENLSLIPGGTSLSRTEIQLTMATDYGRLRELLEPVGGEYEFCILDAPPNPHGGTASALVAAELTILPTPPDPDNLIAVQATLTLIENLRELGYAAPRLVTVLPTMFVDNGTSRAVVAGLERVAPHVLKSRIRHSPTYFRAGAIGLPAVEIARASSVVVKDHQHLADEITELLG